jgi:hypothetical protein
MTAHDATIAGSSAVIDRRYRRRRWSQSFCYRPLVAFFVAMVLTGCGEQPASTQKAEVRVRSLPATSQRAPDEIAAVAAISDVNAAQKTYFARNRRYALTYEELTGALFLKEEPTVEKTGYDIKLRPAADAATYTVLGIPSPPTSPARHYFSDQTGIIRAEEGKDANAQSPAISR